MTAIMEWEGGVYCYFCLVIPVEYHPLLVSTLSCFLCVIAWMEQMECGRLIWVTSFTLTMWIVDEELRLLACWLVCSGVSALFFYHES